MFYPRNFGAGRNVQNKDFPKLKAKKKAITKKKSTPGIGLVSCMKNAVLYKKTIALLSG